MIGNQILRNQLISSRIENIWKTSSERRSRGTNVTRTVTDVSDRKISHPLRNSTNPQSEIPAGREEGRGKQIQKERKRER